MKKQEERLHIFLNAIKNEVSYWATLPSNCFEQARKLRGLSEIQYRLDGFFSRKELMALFAVMYT